MSPRQIFVTNALPYASGPIHLGHLVGYIQADIWVRYQRLRGHEVTYVCADDAHGTPIMLAAEKAGLDPETFVARIQADHERDFATFGVAFDHYHSTHSDENRALSERIYLALRDADLIERREIEQAYDPVRGMFLPDRYVKGECPKCGTADQYGDNCESCGAAYSPREVKNPVSAVSGATPEWRPSEHYFFRLDALGAEIESWLGAAQLNSGVAAKLREWVDSGLLNWDISRDAPYFGFEIPDAPGKYFYVWLDAPIGYLASLKALCDARGRDFETYIDPDSDWEMWHFIGKDIINFHGLFWPAMLHGAGMKQPDGLAVNGFLTVNGAKMSKSRGTFIRAETFAAHIEPEYLRYYFAAKITAGVEDLDLNLDDFRQRVNSDLVGKYVNIASRTAGFIGKRFDGQLGATLDQPALFEDFAAAGDAIADAYEAREFGAAIRQIMALADRANQYVAERAPWVLAKQAGADAELQAVCTTALNLFRLLSLYLQPVLPALTEQVCALLKTPLPAWDARATPLLNAGIGRFQALATRIEEKPVNAIVEASKEDLAPAAAPPPAEQAGTDQAAIGIEDFTRVDLRVARIEKAELVDGADKLLQLTLDVGELGRRQVFAGIRQAYAPEQLPGRLVVLVTNLAPRKMRFGVSEGMVLAAGPGGENIFLLQADEGAAPGMQVK